VPWCADAATAVPPVGSYVATHGAALELQTSASRTAMEAERFNGRFCTVTVMIVGGKVSFMSATIQSAAGDQWQIEGRQ
jgi:hypothetical protein